MSKDGLKKAAMNAKMLAADSASNFTPPKIMQGVAPEGFAMDDSPTYQYLQATGYAGQGFLGFSYLAQLSTVAEYRNIASSLSAEMTRKWIELTSKETDGEETSEKIKAIEAEFIRLDVQRSIRLMAEHDCYFGRSHLFLDFGNVDRSTPLVLDPRTIGKGSFKAVRVVEALWTTPSAYNSLDPAAPDFYKPRLWFMLGQEVHASRLLTAITRPLPDIMKPAYNFAGMSLSQMAKPYIDNWLRTRQSVADLINNFSITALATSMEQVLQGDDSGSNLFARADLFNATRSNRGLMLLDKDREQIVQTNTPLGGLHELQSQAQEQLCSVTRIPSVILTGISPSGLNASSEGELRVFYDWISSVQEAYWRPIIQTVLDCVQLSLFGSIDENIGFSFVPLYQMTPAEIATIRAQNAAAAVSLIGAGVLDPSEERERLASDDESGYRGIDVDAQVYSPADESADIQGGEDASVSAKQHRAMEAAAHGESTLGIPESVGKEFISKDGWQLPNRQK